MIVSLTLMFQSVLNCMCAYKYIHIHVYMVTVKGCVCRVA